MIIGPIRISRIKRKGVKKKRVGASTLEFSGKHDLASVRIFLHLSANWKGAHQHYRHWREVLLNSGLPFICVIRPQGIFDACRAEFPNDPIVLAKRQVDIDALIGLCPNLAAVFFTNHGGNNCHFFAHPEIDNIFIGHGESDKSGSVSLMARAYDELWAAGQAQVDKLSAKMDRVNFRVVGRPQVADLYSPVKRPTDAIITAAYLPTWEGISPDLARYSSMKLAEGLFESLRERDIKICAKLHPSSGARDKSYKEIERTLESKADFDTDITITSAQGDVTEIMKVCDFCIADTSSIVPDWLATHRPLFMYYPDVPRSTTKKHPSEYAYTFSSKEQFIDLIDRVIINKDDYKKEPRISAAEYWISKESTQKSIFIDSMRKIANKKLKS